MATLPETMSDPSMRPAPVEAPIGRRRARAANDWRAASRPWTSGFAGFLTTALVLLPVEYEVALRSALLFISLKRP